MENIKSVGIQAKEQARQMLGSQNYGGARDFLERALESSPDDLELLGLLSTANGQLGLFDATIDCCRKIIAIQPDNTDAIQSMAQALVTKGCLREALPVIERLAQILPEDATVLNNLGSAYMVLNRFSEAEGCFNQAIKLQPEYADPRNNLGRMYALHGRHGMASEVYRDVLHYHPEDLQTRYELANALMGAGEIQASEIEFRHILDKQPDHSDAGAALALLFKKQILFDKSMEVLKPFIDSENIPLPVAVSFAQIAKKYHLEHQAIAFLEEAIPNTNSKTELSPAYYQLGKLYEASGDYDKSFHFYQQANTSQIVTSDPFAAGRLIDENISLWTPEFLKSAPVASHGSEIPVFIFGQPRSGTSLVEQILASHPDVFGAGEIPALPDVVSELPRVLGTKEYYPQSLKKLTQTAVNTLSSRYLDKVEALANGNPLRITDKLPSNYMHAGLIKVFFPEARIIHCIRNPVDTCLSIYFNEFPLSGYTTDLTHLGTHYQKYREMMKHWKDALDLPIMDMHYEDLIDNPEQKTRELLNFCGLQWDEACLNFHENKRYVKTLSHEQVRRPLYRDSINRWKKYERHIQPLIRALDAN